MDVYGWDLRVALWIAAHRNAVVTDVAVAVMKAGMNPRILGPGTLLFLVGAILSRRYALALSTPLAGILAAWTTLVLKQVFERPRPPAGAALAHTAGYSMPSTNAALFAAVTVAVLLSLSPRWRTALTPVAVLANLFADACMVYLGAHWVSDVIAGWVVGIVVGLAVVHGVGLVSARRSNRSSFTEASS